MGERDAFMVGLITGIVLTCALMLAIHFAVSK